MVVEPNCLRHVDGHSTAAARDCTQPTCGLLEGARISVCTLWHTCDPPRYQLAYLASESQDVMGAVPRLVRRVSRTSLLFALATETSFGGDIG